MKKMFVGNLSEDSTEQSVRALFEPYGKVRSIRVAHDVFSGKCKGFGFVEMEGHEARAAIAGLNGKTYGEKFLRVQFEDDRAARPRSRR